MEGFTCDMCGKVLLAEEDSRYIVKVQVYAAYDPMELTAVSVSIHFTLPLDNESIAINSELDFCLIETGQFQTEQQPIIALGDIGNRCPAVKASDGVEISTRER